jgi:hypothetical protein
MKLEFQAHAKQETVLGDAKGLVIQCLLDFWCDPDQSYKLVRRCMGSDPNLAASLDTPAKVQAAADFIDRAFDFVTTAKDK